jgi:four helix bundle protein
MSKDESPTNDQNPRSEARPRSEFDLEERTALFGEAVINFAKAVPATPITREIIAQLIRSATSVGANYCEADEAESNREFLYRISVCKKEAKETKFHLRMLVTAEPACREGARSLWQEAKELTLIFAAIARKKRSTGKCPMTNGQQRSKSQ